MQDKQQEAARRKLLKSAALGGGALVTAKSLSESWTQPVLKSVISPAHAMMSIDNEVEPIVGVFTASGLQGPPVDVQMVKTNSILDSSTQALLNILVPEVKANSTLTNAFCGDSGSSGPPPDTFELIFSINLDGSVDIAFSSSSLRINDGLGSCQGSSMLTGTSIADSSVNLGYGFSGPVDPDGSLNLSNMVASASQVTGEWAFSLNSATSDFAISAIECTGSFTAALGGTYPATIFSCAESEVISS